jgi:hypothetical protein
MLMTESVAAPRTLSTKQLWMYSASAVDSVFGNVTSGERVIELLNIAKMAAARDVGSGRAMTPAVDIDGISGVWRTNRHGGLLGGMLGARYAGTEHLRAEIDVSNRLRALRVYTPQVLLAAAVRDGMYWTQHLVTAEVEGAVTVFDARDDERAMRATGECLRQLFAAGYFAADLHPRNMLWVAETQQVWVIDLAGAKMLDKALSPKQSKARMKRFERFFVKHAGKMPSTIGVLREGLNG